METESYLSYWKSIIANFNLVSLKHKKSSDLETLTKKSLLWTQRLGKKSERENIFERRKNTLYFSIMSV